MRIIVRLPYQRTHSFCWPLIRFYPPFHVPSFVAVCRHFHSGNRFTIWPEGECAHLYVQRFEKNNNKKNTFSVTKSAVYTFKGRVLVGSGYKPQSSLNMKYFLLCVIFFIMLLLSHSLFSSNGFPWGFWQAWVALFLHVCVFVSFSMSLNLTLCVLCLVALHHCVCVFFYFLSLTQLEKKMPLYFEFECFVRRLEWGTLLL